MNTVVNFEVKTSSTEITVKNITDGEVLVIDRQADIDGGRPVFHSYGVYGMIAMNQSSYLIFIVDADEKGMMHEHAVHEVIEVEIVQLRRGGSEDFSGEISDIRRFFKASGVYFSTYPLYRTISISKDEDTDFLFNLVPLRRFFKDAGEEGIPFSVYCIQGFFGSAEVGPASLRLISRRSWRRAGARYFCRGSDASGYVSNYVETEQVLYDKDKTVSYLQIRGSIPLMWEHILGREYNPRILVDNTKILHVADKILENKYGKVLYLNLIRDSGYEKTLYDIYERELAESSKECVHFNFFKEGGILEGPSRRKFLELIEETLTSFGYFCSDRFQSGVVRTNCIDCLDRTNISQFIIGGVVFGKQMAHFDVEDRKTLRDRLKHLWHDNGNLLSLQYSGSHALKTYLLHNQREGFDGRLRDMAIGLKRYFVNRFHHGALQTTYDILTTECEGKNIHVYRDGAAIIGRVVGLSLLVTWTVTLMSSGAVSLKPFLWNSMTTVFTVVIIMVAFLEFFIQKPGYMKDSR